MVTIVLEEFFGFAVTVVIGFSKFSNGQTTKEAEMVFVAIAMGLIFLQTNDIAVVLDIIGEFGWLSEWVCSHDEMQTKVHDAFNDPFRVWSLFFQKRGEIFGSYMT